MTIITVWLRRSSLMLLLLTIFLFCTQAQNAYFTTPQWAKNANIYEVNIRQYTPQGTFKAFEAELPRLRQLGVDILWLMPVQPIGKEKRKGSLGSYYSIQNYTATNPEFGTMDDFKSLVNAAHRLGMYVILDWVGNHSAWDNPWLKTNPDWYTRNEKGEVVPPVADWSDVADLNYENPAMQQAMIDAMKFWVKEVDIDGFRCDVAMMIPLDFWIAARTATDTPQKPLFWLAEGEGAEFHRVFDMTYGWNFHHLLNDLAKEKKNNFDIDDYFKNEYKSYAPGNYRMQFITNHDENSWNGSEFERMGAAYQPLAVLTFTMPGMPLLYSGQEYGLQKRLRFFDKDTIPATPNAALTDFYGKLLQLKKENPALWNGIEGGCMKKLQTLNPANRLVFIREKDGNKVITLLNLNSSKTKFSVNMRGQYGKFRNVFDGSEIEFLPEHSFELPAWGYAVYEQRTN